MTTDHPAPGARFQRIGPDELKERLEGPQPPLVLDIRRGAAFEEVPGVPSAVPFPLDQDPIRLPDLARDHPILAYCL